MNNKKGISLIVLVITIIVIIILASAVIIAFSKNNPIDSAKEAKDVYNETVIKEHVSLDIQSMNLQFALNNKEPNIEDYIQESLKYSTRINNIGRITYDGIETNLSLNRNFLLEESRHIITGYWQNWNSDSKSVNLKLVDVPREYDIVAIAFGITNDGSPKGKVDFSVDEYLNSHLGGYTDDNFKEDIKALKKRGQNVILSIGGAADVVTVDDEASKNNFVNSVYNLIEEYGFQGIDIDIESGISPEYISQAIRELYNKVGPRFIVTLTPQTADYKMNRNKTVSGQYFELAKKIKDILTIVNIQLFNSGSQYGQDTVEYFPQTIDFITGVTAILLENELNQNQVGIGLNYLGAEKRGVTPQIAVEGFDALVNGRVASGGSYVPLKSYEELGGFMIWSINGDYKNSNTYLNEMINEYKKIKK